MNLQLSNKVAIVTGSSRGLGLATAAALVEELCNVTICARGEAGLSAAADQLRAALAATATGRSPSPHAA